MIHVAWAATVTCLRGEMSVSQGRSMSRVVRWFVNDGPGIYGNEIEIYRCED